MTTQKTTSPRNRIAACDWSMEITNSEALTVARKLGIQGVEVNVGPAADQLRISAHGVQAQYKADMQCAGVVVTSVCICMLNEHPLTQDKRGPSWIQQATSAAHNLGAGIVLMPFFGDGDLREGTTLKRDAIDTVCGILRDAAPDARKAGIRLGIENTLTATDSLRMLDQIGHDNVCIYYDVGNAGHFGYDRAAEIRQMGSRMCQLHFKDGGYLGEGGVDVPAVAAALSDIRYDGWLVLETNCPSGNRDADFKRNADYLKSVFG